MTMRQRRKLCRCDWHVVAVYKHPGGGKLYTWAYGFCRKVKEHMHDR